MDDSWDAVKTSVATVPLNEALKITIYELRTGLVHAKGAVQMMQHTQREADQVRYREMATTGLERTNQVINELLVDIIGQRLKRE